MDKNNVIRQEHLPSYPSIDQTADALNVKRPRPSALFSQSICQAGQLTSFATLPYQKTNRYAVVGEIVISILSNLAQKHRILSRIHVLYMNLGCQQTYNSLCTCQCRCAIYRVTIDIKAPSCIFSLPKTYGVSSRSRILYMSLGQQQTYNNRCLCQ